MNDSVLRGLADIIEEVANVDASGVTPGKSLVDDPDIDSLSMVEIAVQAENKFGAKIPDDALANLKTVGDVVEYVTGTAGSEKFHLTAAVPDAEAQ